MKINKFFKNTFNSFLNFQQKYRKGIKTSPNKILDILKFHNPLQCFEITDLGATSIEKIPKISASWFCFFGLGVTEKSKQNLSLLSTTWLWFTFWFCLIINFYKCVSKPWRNLPIIQNKLPELCYLKEQPQGEVLPLEPKPLQRCCMYEI